MSLNAIFLLILEEKKILHRYELYLESNPHKKFSSNSVMLEGKKIESAGSKGRAESAPYGSNRVNWYALPPPFPPVPESLDLLK